MKVVEIQDSYVRYLIRHWGRWYVIDETGIIKKLKDVK